MSSLYKFSRGPDDNDEGPSAPPTRRRLFVQGGTASSDTGGALSARYTHRHVRTELLGSSLESTRVTQRTPAGTRHITTRIVRKTTTLTRGEESRKDEDLYAPPRRVARLEVMPKHYRATKVLIQFLH